MQWASKCRSSLHRRAQKHSSGQQLPLVAEGMIGQMSGEGRRRVAVAGTG